MKKYVGIIAVVACLVGLLMMPSTAQDIQGNRRDRLIDELVALVNTWGNGSGAIDGENIAADTIDDDAIDFTDITAADLDMTDSGNLGVQGSITLTSTNGATTNVIGTVNGTLDGETIADDTIDDDAIDFTDVTAADLTLTDAAAITASGTLTANGAVYFDNVSMTFTNLPTSAAGLDPGRLWVSNEVLIVVP